MLSVVYLQPNCKKNIIMSRPRFNLDIVGMVLSLACALHCLAVPLLLMFGAFTGLHFLADPAIEHTVIFGSIIIAGLSLIPHYFHHRRKEVLVTATTGFALIFIGHFFGLAWLHGLLVAAGGAAVAVSHLLNWRYCRDLEVCK